MKDQWIPEIFYEETETGITIHYVNKNYDEGAIIFQAKCKVKPLDSAEDVAAKIHKLEMNFSTKLTIVAFT